MARLGCTPPCLVLTTPCHAGSLPSKAELRLQTSTRYLAQSVAQIVQRGSTSLQEEACLLLDTDLDSIQPALEHNLQVTMHMRTHTHKLCLRCTFEYILVVAPLASCSCQPCVLQVATETMLSEE